MSMDSKNKGGIVCCGFIGIILLFVIFVEFIVPLLHADGFEEGFCNITDITYPTDIITYNDTSNWVECDCGTYCTSWSPCINLYTDLSPNVVIKDELYYSRNDICTFYNRECPDAENYQNLERYLNEAQALYNKYINTTVSCYYNEDMSVIYLDYSVNVDLFIGLCSGIGFTILCSCFMILCNYN